MKKKENLVGIVGGIFILFLILEGRFSNLAAEEKEGNAAIHYLKAIKLMDYPVSIKRRFEIQEAIKKGCYLVDYLSRITVPYFGYRVPHLLISCKNRDEVNMAFNCLESIMFETRPNKDIIEKIGIVHKKVTDFIILEPLEGLEEISRSIETMAKKAASKTPVAGHVTTSITLKKISSVSVEKTTYMTRMKGIEAEKELAEFKLFQNPKMWNLAKAVEVLLPGIQECIIINKKNDAYYVAHSGKQDISPQQKEALMKIIELLRISDSIGSFDTITLSGNGESITIYKGAAIVVLKKKNR